MEISAKRFSFSSYPALDTILKLLQSPETQGIKYKKETITTFRIPLTPSCSKFSQNPTDYVSLSPFPSRIFFLLWCSSLCCWLVI